MPLENHYYAECLNERITLRPGDILFIAPGCLHSLFHPREGGVRIIFQADPSILRGMKEIETIISFLSPVYIATPEAVPEIYDELRRLMLSIKDEYLNNGSFSEAAIYSKVLAMLVLIGRNFTRETPRLSLASNKHQEYADKFMKICDFINTHCTEDLNLEEIANIAGFSKFHFSRLFKQFTNDSFYQYLSKQRIYTAERLLANPECSITEVAYNSGFTSLSSFIRMFKQIKGITPSEFRTMYRK